MLSPLYTMKGFIPTGNSLARVATYDKKSRMIRTLDEESHTREFFIF